MTAILLVVLSGLVKGHWANHATAAKELQAATARMRLIPWTIGDWIGEAAELDERGLDRAGIAGHVSRRYTNRRTGTSITILLVVGRPGSIAVHGPEICYTGSGYERVTPIVKRNMGDGDFWMTRFRKEGPVEAPSLRIDWAWSEGDRWQASMAPRLQFANYFILYKLYIISNEQSSAMRNDDSCIRDFADVLLPVVKNIIVLAP